jgi:hypothetical protein
MVRDKKSVDSDTRVDQVATMVRNGYLPAVDVASRMGVSLTTIGRWADQEMIESETVGHRRFVKVSSLINHIGVTQAQIFGFLTPEGAGKKKKAAGEKL